MQGFMSSFELKVVVAQRSWTIVPHAVTQRSEPCCAHNFDFVACKARIPTHVAFGGARGRVGVLGTVLEAAHLCGMHAQSQAEW